LGGIFGLWGHKKTLKKHRFSQTGHRDKFPDERDNRPGEPDKFPGDWDNRPDDRDKNTSDRDVYPSDDLTSISFIKKNRPLIVYWHLLLALQTQSVLNIIFKSTVIGFNCSLGLVLDDKGFTF